jgi:hypothetical protein
MAGCDSLPNPFLSNREGSERASLGPVVAVITLRRNVNLQILRR